MSFAGHIHLPSILNLVIQLLNSKIFGGHDMPVIRQNQPRQRFDGPVKTDTVLIILNHPNCEGDSYHPRTEWSLTPIRN